MIILVEGIDASGKSTLIEELSEVLDYKKIRGSSFELTANKTNSQLFDAFMNLTDEENAVFDRYIYSNFVYAPLYEDYSVLDEKQLRYIERELIGSAVVVYLTADTEVIKQRFKTRGEEYVSVDKIEAIKELYEEALSNSLLPVFKYDTTSTSTKDIVNDILCKIEK